MTLYLLAGAGIVSAGAVVAALLARARAAAQVAAAALKVEKAEGAREKAERDLSESEARSAALAAEVGRQDDVVRALRGQLADALAELRRHESGGDALDRLGRPR